MESKEESYTINVDNTVTIPQTQVVHDEYLKNHLENNKCCYYLKCTTYLIFPLHFFVLLISFCWSLYTMTKFKHYLYTTGFKFAIAMYVYPFYNVCYDIYVYYI